METLLTFNSIVAVHGLNGDAFKTWTAPKTKKFWLGDLDMLPANLKDSRILTYSYNATIAAIRGKTSSDTIMQHAHTFVAELVADRQVIISVLPTKHCSNCRGL
jgi:protein SERAC1